MRESLKNEIALPFATADKIRACWVLGGLIIVVSRSVFLFLDSNIAEQLVEKGLASVVRHKRDDEDRSADYDKLMAAEQT